MISLIIVTNVMLLMNMALQQYTIIALYFHVSSMCT